MRSLGEHIAAQRDRFELTQAELAARLHVSPRAVSAWEHGRSVPAPEIHELLELVLNWETSISDVLEGWEPWDLPGSLKSGCGPQAYWKAPPGREEIWRQAREKVELALEAEHAAPRTGKFADARLT